MYSPNSSQSESQPGSSRPEILPAAPALASRVSSRISSNENLDLLSHMLDDWLRIPGTSIRFGIDAIVGLVPGFGDLLVGLFSCILPVVAWMRGVPYVTLARMIVNLLLDVFIGAIPIVGDAFHVTWKANRRNYALMTRHLQQPHRHTWKDRIFIFLLVLAVLAVLALPMVILLWLMTLLRHHGVSHGSGLR